MGSQRAILFANGPIEDVRFLVDLIKPSDFLIAVDGGLRHLDAIGRLPDLLIGDLDSITLDQFARIEKNNVEIQKYPTEKDETDLELALLWSTKKGFKEIIIVCALGGRTDQTLANLFLLLLPELSGLKVQVLSPIEEIFLVTNKSTVLGKAGDLISLLPIGGIAVGVTTAGLKYGLTNDTLYPNKSRGISNRMVLDQAEIEVLDGTLLCIHTISQPGE
jgi:thiamine pyrophosphokinase